MSSTIPPRLDETADRGESAGVARSEPWIGEGPASSSIWI
jgi:hypothetical protein